MLFRVELQNFYSVRALQSLDLRVSPKVADPNQMFGPLYPKAEVRVPKVVALFGANGSGKSHVLRGLSFLSWFIQNSFSWAPATDQPQPGGFQPCDRFFANEAADEPTRLCVHFTGPINLFEAATEASQWCRYAYEVSFESKLGKPRNVLHEALRQWPNTSGKSVRVFERNDKHEVVGSKLFSLTGYRNVIDKVRSNASVVSTLAQFDHKASLLLRSVAALVVSNLLIEKVEINDQSALLWYSTAPPMLQRLNEQLQRIDIGIKEMKLQAGPQGPLAWFEHAGLSSLVPMNLESHGTRQFVRVFPYLAHALATGGVAVVDELDQSIHPVVLDEIIRWFRDPTTNPHNAQVWMTCQNPAALEELQKEEVVFCEKDSHGRTRIYSLQDVQAVRRSDNLYKKYLGGVYGAVPHVG